LRRVPSWVALQVLVPRADKIREQDSSTSSHVGLPTLQQLRTTHRDWLVQEEIVFISGCFNKYATKLLAVSHCDGMRKPNRRHQSLPAM